MKSNYFMDFYIKDGFELNPNDKVVNSIIKMVEKNNGICPCKHPDGDGDLHCPCASYRLRDKCCCNLYVKKKNNNCDQ